MLKLMGVGCVELLLLKGVVLVLVNVVEIGKLCNDVLICSMLVDIVVDCLFEVFSFDVVGNVCVYVLLCVGEVL